MEILPSPNSKSLGAYIFYRSRRFQRPPCYCRILWDANILDVAQIFYVCADILDRRECHGRKHFIGANISGAQTFHGRKRFMGANISGAQTFHGREHVMGANILRCVHTVLIGSKYFVCKLLFLASANTKWFLQWVLHSFIFAMSFVCFCNKFCFDFCCKYLCLFSVSIYACCVRQYFCRKCFEI